MTDTTKWPKECPKCGEAHPGTEGIAKFIGALLTLIEP